MHLRDYGYMHKAIELFRLTKLAFSQIKHNPYAKTEKN